MEACEHFLAKWPPDSRDELREGRGRLKLVDRSRPGKGHLDLRLETPWPRRHHQHSVAEHERLVDAVGDVDDRFPVGLPDSEELLLEQNPGLLVDAGER